jgi:hypothetical protein
MVGVTLMQLIEKHSERLARGLTEQICRSERTSDFRKIPAKDLQLAAAEVYRNLGEWLLQKTEQAIEQWFRAIGSRRAAEGIRLHQFVWALMLTREHLCRFLEQEALADSIIQLHSELEFQQIVNQFFDRAVYYGIIGYSDPVRQESPKSRASTSLGEMAIEMLQGLSLA